MVKRKRLMFVALGIVCFCIYACYDGLEWDGLSVRSSKSKKSNKELTVAAARSWYESNYLPVVTMRSSVDVSINRKDAMVKPNWKDARESRSGRYEVVETSLLTRERRIFIDEETRRGFSKVQGEKYLRNVARMVVMKDLKTGDIRSFVAIFVGSLEYLKKTKRLSKNSYLHREPDFDGRVLFFEPNGGLVNGWKYKKGKIVAKIMPISEEDAKFVLTRAMKTEWVEECTIEYEYQEVRECEEESNPYFDEEFGWGVETTVTCITHEIEIPVQVCEWIQQEIEEEEEDSGSSGPIDPPVLPPSSPKAKAIFRNSKMTEQNWEIIENMINKITQDCMGENLYNSLKNILNGKTLSIQFENTLNGSFGPQGVSVGITLGMQMESNQLFHEMFHAYQWYQETVAEHIASNLNDEIETHYAQYLYLSKLPEYPGSKWEKRDRTNERRRAIKGLSEYLDNKGRLFSGQSVSNLRKNIQQVVIPSFRLTGYPEDSYKFNNDRSTLENFENIKTLTVNCGQ